MRMTTEVQVDLNLTLDANLTESRDLEYTRRIYRVIFAITVLGVSLGVCAIFLNFVFLLTTRFLKNYSVSYRRLIRSLSVADALASSSFILVLWPTGPFASIDYEALYTLSGALPYVLRSTPWMFFTGYLLTLTCLTLNQYLAVCQPWTYKSRGTRRLFTALLVAVWAVSSCQILVPCLTLVVLAHADDRDRATDTLVTVAQVEIQVWLTVFLLSTVMNVILDCLMYRQIRRLRRLTEVQTRTSPASSSPSHAEGRNLRMKQEAFVTISLLLLTSIFCRLPFPLMGLVYQNLYLSLSLEARELTHATLVLLLYLNFAVDPVIYTCRTKDVRRGLKKVVLRMVACVDVKSKHKQPLWV